MSVRRGSHAGSGLFPHDHGVAEGQEPVPVGQRRPVQVPPPGTAERLEEDSRSVERGRWKLVISTSTTAKAEPGRMYRSLCPSSTPVAAAVSRARTVVVPTATTRRGPLAGGHGLGRDAVALGVHDVVLDRPGRHGPERGQADGQVDGGALAHPRPGSASRTLAGQVESGGGGGHRAGLVGVDRLIALRVGRAARGCTAAGPRSRTRRAARRGRPGSRTAAPALRPGVHPPRRPPRPSGVAARTVPGGQPPAGADQGLPAPGVRPPGSGSSSRTSAAPPVALTRRRRAGSDPGGVDDQHVARGGAGRGRSRDQPVDRPDRRGRWRRAGGRRRVARLAAGRWPPREGRSRARPSAVRQPTARRARSRVRHGRQYAPGRAGRACGGSAPAAASSPRCCPGRRGVATRPRGVRMSRPELQQVRLVDVLDRVGLLADAHGQGRQADRTAAEAGADGVQDGPVHLVEAQLVHPEQLEALAGPPPRRRCRRRGPRRSPGPASAAGWRCGAYPGTAGRSRPPRWRRGGPRGSPAERRMMASRSPALVVVQPGDEPEPVAERPGDEPGAGGGARPG